METTNASVAELRQNHATRMRSPEVLSIAYHRNGVCGDGFYVALIRGGPDVDQRVLTAIVPAWSVEGDPSPGGGVPCFVIDPELASGPWTKPGTVEFGVNSWRGDHYHDLVVAAVQIAREAELGVVR